MKHILINRREAKRQNMDTYYLKPCKYGHTDGRFISNNKCVKCFKTNLSYKQDIAKELSLRYKEVEVCGKVIEVPIKATKMAFKDIKLPHVKKARTDLAAMRNRIIQNKNLYNKSPFEYSANDLKKHLQSKFKTGMTWDNIGKWHIDHIIPIYQYTLTHKDYSPASFSKLVNQLDNLQPLWAIDNLKKSFKM